MIQRQTRWGRASLGAFAAVSLVFSAASALAQSFSGTYKGDGLTLVLKPVPRQGNRYSGTVSLGAQKFAAKGQFSGKKFSGSFQSGGQSFAFTLRRSGSGAVFVTGDTTYNLRAQGQGGGNPLARTAPNPLGGTKGGGGMVPRSKANDKSGYLGLVTMMDDDNQMRVYMVVDGGPAQKAGLRRGDIIRSVAGRAVTSDDQITAVMLGPVGSRLPMVVARENEDGDQRQFNVTVVRGLMPTVGGRGNGGGGRIGEPDDGPTGEQSDEPVGEFTPTAVRRAPVQKAPQRVGKRRTAPVARMVTGSFPAPLQVGTRIVYNAGDSVVQGASSRVVRDANGWKDDRGNTWRTEQLESSGGVGYTTLDIVQTTPSFVAADVRTFLAGFNNAISLGSIGVVTGNGAALGDGLMKYWISPARLAGMRNGRSGGHQVSRMRYAVGGGTFNAISISDTSAAAYANEIYDLKTGLLLASSRSNRGSAQHVLGADNRIGTGQGAVVMSHMRLVGTRKRTLPWSNSPAPGWAKAGTRLAYNGQVQNVMFNSGLPPLPATGASFSCVINRVIGGCVIANTLSRQDNGTPIPSEAQQTRVYATTSVGGLWIPPGALQRLRPGQVLDQDPFTRTRLTFAGLQNGAALFTEQGQTDQFTYAYNPQNGMLVGFDVTNGKTSMGEQRRQFRLAGAG